MKLVSFAWSFIYVSTDNIIFQLITYGIPRAVYELSFVKY